MAAKNHWQIEFDDIKTLEEKVKRIPSRAEEAINNVLHIDGIQIVVDEIQPNIPVSKWKSRIRKKKHARDMKNVQQNKKENLSFTIRPKPKFNYLKYPDLAIGTSQHNEPQMFMNKGLKLAAPKIIKELNETLEKIINESLGGS
jgi:HK97 gp10 family phage protein